MTARHLHAHRAPFAARRPAKDARTLRAEWVSALAMASELGRVAGGAAGGEDLTAADTFGALMTRLRVGLRDLEPGNFPVAAASAQAMAGAWLKLARAFVDPAWPPAARTACAGFLRAGGGCLDGLLGDLRAAESHGTRRMLGERDED